MNDLVRLERPNFPAEVKLEDEWIIRRDEILVEAKKITEIGSQKDYDNAEVSLSRITKVSNDAEKKRKDFTKPYNEFSKQIKAMADDARKGLEDKKLDIKLMMKDFVIKKEKEAQEELERKAQIVANSSFGKQPTEIAVASGHVSHSMSSVRKTWKFEIEDASLIPREYLAIDEVKIRAHIQANKGMASIAGVRIFEDTDVQAR